MTVTHVKLHQRVYLALQGGHPFQQLLHGHGPHGSVRTGTMEGEEASGRAGGGEVCGRIRDGTVVNDTIA